MNWSLDENGYCLFYAFSAFELKVSYSSVLIRFEFSCGNSPMQTTLTSAQARKLADDLDDFADQSEKLVPFF